MRIIFVPQYPTPNRYPEWWLWRFPKEFRKAGFEVLVLGEDYLKLEEIEAGKAEMFSPINNAIAFETDQINEYMELVLRDDDILFLADVSFPGIFCSTLYHKKPSRCFAFCHATSINNFDYFQPLRDSKFLVETAHAHLFDKVFVGSEYHKNKLGWANTVVTYLPNPDHIKTFEKETKVNSIVSASRPTQQKVDLYLEKKVERELRLKIVRQETETAEEYYKFLGQSQVLLITAFEDTFGYQIVDAINNGCIPIARNNYAYPELLAREYLYESDREIFTLLEKALWGLLPLPRLQCKEQMKNFFNKIIKEMM